MSALYVVSDNIISPLGFTTSENFANLNKDISGIRLHKNNPASSEPFYACLFDKKQALIQEDSAYTKFERLLIASITGALKNTGIDARDKKTILLISTTKGNISLLENHAMNAGLEKRMALHSSAKLVAEHFGFSNSPLVISSACISGVLAIITAKRLIESGLYENAVIAGADIISKFVLSGFQAFQAISSEPCQPFDKNRKGITLGEGAATIILSSNKKYSAVVKVMGGGVSNDANHISAPSRTGEELAYTIKTALHDSCISANDIDFVSAHGTATLYNDAMEAKAITLAGLQPVPVNSLKGYYGHTLGAAGLIESIISIQSLKENSILPTKGFMEMDEAAPLNIQNIILNKPLQNCLKIASGFGGCNAAVIFSKE
jgi:3-oxoacyl-[acyl-carrier-protein] synthase-1